MPNHSERCVSCAERGVPLDADGQCHMCCMAHGLKAMAAQLNEQEQRTELHREPAAGSRLAAVIATTAATMSQAERAQLWWECCLLLGPIVDKDTHPELYTVIRSLRDALPAEAQAAKWN